MHVFQEEHILARQEFLPVGMRAEVARVVDGVEGHQRGAERVVVTQILGVRDVGSRVVHLLAVIVDDGVEVAQCVAGIILVCAVREIPADVEGVPFGEDETVITAHSGIEGEGTVARQRL